MPSTHNPVPPCKEEYEQVQEGWEVNSDEVGRVFYYNLVTGKSQWRLPSLPAFAGEGDTPQTVEEARQRWVDDAFLMSLI